VLCCKPRSTGLILSASCREYHKYNLKLHDLATDTPRKEASTAACTVQRGRACLTQTNSKADCLCALVTGCAPRACLHQGRHLELRYPHLGADYWGGHHGVPAAQHQQTGGRTRMWKTLYAHLHSMTAHRFANQTQKQQMVDYTS
jgi:hypothetical protein